MLDSNSEPRTILLPYSHSLNKIVIDIIMTTVIKFKIMKFCGNQCDSLLFFSTMPFHKCYVS